MRVVVAGAWSGTGKTSVATGLIGALRRRGLNVAAFKAGPDYIDPSYHTLAAGAPSRNLDSWMLDAPALREIFHQAASKCDIAIVEGVMGLFDGKSGGDSTGSTADLAKTLDAPVILVVDVSGMAQSAAALVLGYQRFDPSLRLAGVILNNVGSVTHAHMAFEAISAGTGLPVLGYLPRRDDLTIPERHLGLIPTAENASQMAGVVRALADQVEQSVDLDALLDIAKRCSPTRASGSGVFPGLPLPVRARIGIAMDEAFSFYYQDNLDLLARWGANLVFFSPLNDRRLPRGVDGLYIGGGFPEMYAERLEANAAMRRAVARVIKAGLPTYAECGGLMYLGKGIVDFEGGRRGMVGAIPVWSTMQRRQVALGYRTVRARRDTVLLRAGESLRGHEFHWSLSDAPSADQAAYDVVADGPSPERFEGFARGNLLASYVHLHFASKRELALRFVETCAAWGRSQRMLVNDGH